MGGQQCLQHTGVNGSCASGYVQASLLSSRTISNNGQFDGVCVPGESFSNKFNEEPEKHTFPLASVGHNNTIKVSVVALPRSNVIPLVVCSYHDANTASSKSFDSGTGTSSSSSSPSRGASQPSPGGARKSSPLGACADDREGDCHYKQKYLAAKRGSESGIMLGDSLLDPPQLLEMYPKRYQSPSRSGSPVMETPEHWMFGGARNRRGASSRLSSEPCSDERSVERGRPWLKKRLDDTGGNNANRNKYGCKLTCSETEEVGSEEDSRFTAAKALLVQLKQSATALSPEETVQLLMTIQHKHLQLKGSKYDRLLLEKLEQNREVLDLLQQMGSNPPESTKPISAKWGLKKSCVWADGPSGMPLSPLVRESSAVPVNTQDGLVVKRRSCMAKSAAEEDTKDKYSHLGAKQILALQKDAKERNSRRISVDEGEYFNGHLADAGAQDSPDHLRKEVPSASDKAKFRRSLDTAACLVFHSRSGLPLTSSPAPLRKGTRFDFDSSLTSVAAIKHALFEKNGSVNEEEPCKQLSTSAPPSVTSNTNLLGNFEESVLNGRLEPVSTVEGFTAEIGASGSFCPRHIILPVTVFFYKLSDADKVSTPYLGHINLGKKGYLVPKSGTIQVTLFNPHGTVVKMFVVMYDLRDMPSHCQTFLRQRTLYMPVDASDEDPEARSWLRYLAHLRFASSKSGRIYLHTDIRIVVFRKSDMDMTPVPGEATYELRSFTRGPSQPRFSSRK